jgi:amino-acid N-acetyltransferase
MTTLQLVRSTAPAIEQSVSLDEILVRHARMEDAPAIHRLIATHQAEGHLLPRTIDDVTRRAERFVVACAGDEVIACGELAPLSHRVAEIRSLVVDRAARGRRLGNQIVDTLTRRAERLGFEQLCVFTHEPRYFIRFGFSIVPHTWVPDKIAVDCHSCALFRSCGQFAMLKDLAAPARSQRDASFLLG